MIKFNTYRIHGFSWSLDWFLGLRRLPTFSVQFWRWGFTINSPWRHEVSDID